MKTHRVCVTASIAACVLFGAARAHAETPPSSTPATSPRKATDPPPDTSAATSPSVAESTSHYPHLVGDVRAMLLARSSDNYFQHTDVFRYSMPSVAGGLSMTAGVEIVPRFALLAGGHYALDGADRADAHLRLTSGAILGLARWSFLRVEDPDHTFLVDAALTGGFGRYLIHETYVNTALSPQTFTTDGSSFGGLLGVEGSCTIHGFRLVAGYAFHYAPAAISDRIDGSVYAGGHEFSIGVGARL